MPPAKIELRCDGYPVRGASMLRGALGEQKRDIDGVLHLQFHVV